MSLLRSIVQGIVEWLMAAARRLAASSPGMRRAARRRDLEAAAADEVRDEIDFHLEMRVRELVDDGVGPAEARRRALHAFGNLDSVDAECRRLTIEQHHRAGHGARIESVGREVLFAIRSLRRRPLITGAAVIILAAGLAVATVVYGLIDALLLRALPVAAPQRLVALFNHSDEAGYFSSVSYPDFLDYRERSRALRELFGYGTTEVTVAGETDRPARATAHPVTADYFRGLGLQAAAGRLFGDDALDDRGGEAVVVISHALWRQRFGAQSDTVGRSMKLNGIDATIVGVAPPGFRGVETESIADLWIPIGLYARLEPGFAPFLYDQRGAHWLTVLGRLADGRTIDDARAEMTLLSAQQAEAHPDSNAAWRIRVFDAGAGVIWPERRGGIVTLSRTLLAGVALVLLIACANVANLMLVRAAGQRTELGIRLALGAGRTRLVRQMLTECLLLAAAGGVLGVLLAAWLRAALSGTVVPADLDHLLAAGSRTHMVTFTLVAALVAGTAFGLVPALRASRPDLMASLKAGDRQRGGRRLSLGSGLVVAQIALSLPLLVGAALVGRSLHNQLTVDLGMSTDGMLVAMVDPAAGGYERTEGERIYRELLQRIETMPGVTDTAYAKVLPLGRIRMATDIRIPGGEPAAGDTEQNVEVNIVSPGYPATSGVELLLGRDFSANDTAAAAKVVLINEIMAQRYWPGADALGRAVEFDWFEGPVHATVVGVIADHAYGRVRADQVQIADPRPRVYLPLAQSYQTSMMLLVRTSTGTTALVRPLVEAMRELAPATPDVEVESFRQHVARLLPQQRLVTALLAIAGGIGLFLATAGIYAVMAYSVSRRAHEMGIRRALGAQRGDVMRLVMRESLTICLVGLAIGTLAAVAATRLLGSMLYGVAATDPLSYAAVAAIVVAVGLLAGYLPARDAADSDPRRVLRRV